MIADFPLDGWFLPDLSGLGNRKYPNFALLSDDASSRHEVRLSFKAALGRTTWTRAGFKPALRRTALLFWHVREFCDSF